MTPDLVIYTDVDRDLKFNPEVDKREVLLGLTVNNMIIPFTPQPLA